jgi:hypothetical protein
LTSTRKHWQRQTSSMHGALLDELTVEQTQELGRRHIVESAAHGRISCSTTSATWRAGVR